MAAFGFDVDLTDQVPDGSNPRVGATAGTRIDMKHSVNMSTERLRWLLAELHQKESDYRVCAADDIVGPGGAAYITANTELTPKHLEWLERRNPDPDNAPTTVDVVFYRGLSAESRPPEGAQAEEPARGARRQRAEVAAAEVTERARLVATKAEKVYGSIGKLEVTAADLRTAESSARLKELEESLREFHASVRKAIDEYLDGNTLVLDLILKFQLDKQTVRHALNVAAFATEMAAQMALKPGEEDERLTTYFGNVSDEEMVELLGEEVPEEAWSSKERSGKLMQLFRLELVEIFLAGFMHDCGLWNEPYFLDEGHEIKGARIVSELPEVSTYAPALIKVVLMHSDLSRLAKRFGVVKITEYPDDPERITLRREFFETEKEAESALKLRRGDFKAELLSAADLRKILPVALAEYYITQTQDLHAKSHSTVVTDLVRHAEKGPFVKYMVVLCNSRIDVVAPRRSYVRLGGAISVLVQDRKRELKAKLLDVTGFDAGSLYHGDDRHSPHLISIFVRQADGRREKAEYVAADDTGLWDRSAGLHSRMYIPAGRFKNTLDFRVTGFMGEEAYEKILGEYEEELKKRKIS